MERNLPSKPQTTLKHLWMGTVTYLGHIYFEVEPELLVLVSTFKLLLICAVFGYTSAREVFM